MSWQISSEKNGHICVKIRFNGTEKDSISAPVSYKRKAPSQVKRDHTRAMAHRVKQLGNMLEQNAPERRVTRSSYKDSVIEEVRSDSFLPASPYMAVSPIRHHHIWLSVPSRITIYGCQSHPASPYMAVSPIPHHHIWLSVPSGITIYGCQSHPASPYMAVSPIPHHHIWLSVPSRITIYGCQSHPASPYMAVSPIPHHHIWLSVPSTSTDIFPVIVACWNIHRNMCRMYWMALTLPRSLNQTLYKSQILTYLWIQWVPGWILTYLWIQWVPGWILTWRTRCLE